MCGNGCYPKSTGKAAKDAKMGGWQSQSRKRKRRTTALRPSLTLPALTKLLLPKQPPHHTAGTERCGRWDGPARSFGGRQVAAAGRLLIAALELGEPPVHAGVGLLQGVQLALDLVVQAL